MTTEEITAIIKELKQGESFHYDDYFGGEMLSFGFDTEKQLFSIQRIDTVVGSYNETTYHPQSEVERVLNRLL